MTSNEKATSVEIKTSPLLDAGCLVKEAPFLMRFVRGGHRVWKYFTLMRAAEQTLPVSDYLSFRMTPWEGKETRETR